MADNDSHFNVGLTVWDKVTRQCTYIYKTSLEEKGSELRAVCEIRDGRPGLPVPNRLYSLCGRKATLNLNWRKESPSRGDN